MKVEMSLDEIVSSTDIAFIKDKHGRKLFLQHRDNSDPKVMY
jgi:hypothetical protein